VVSVASRICPVSQSRLSATPSDPILRLMHPFERNSRDHLTSLFYGVAIV